MVGVAVHRRGPVDGDAMFLERWREASEVFAAPVVDDEGPAGKVRVCTRRKCVLVNAEVAHAAARRVHAGQLTRSGEPLIAHVERVASAVPAESRTLAYLHDMLERADGAMEELRELGINEIELAVLCLLTRHPDETYTAYVMRIARADGKPGRIARTIKLADLDDHLRQRPVARSPDYMWGRERILASQHANGEQ